MAKISCRRCSLEKDGLEEAPFKNEVGQKVLAGSCRDCWQAWVSQQLMLMNEYRLDPLNDEHSQFLDNEMLKFLNLN